AGQFSKFMDRIGAPIRRAELAVRRLFNGELIEDVFWARECAFDAGKLAEVMGERVHRAGVHVRTSVTVKKMRATMDGLEADLGDGAVITKRAFLCGYS